MLCLQKNVVDAIQNQIDKKLKLYAGDFKSFKDYCLSMVDL